MRESQLKHGVDRASAYQLVLHIMVGLLIIGFLCNLLVRPVAEKYWARSETPAIGGGHWNERGKEKLSADDRSGMADRLHPGRVGRLQHGTERNEALPLAEAIRRAKVVRMWPK